MTAGRELDEVEQQAWLAWLDERTDGDGFTGFDAGGWPDATWVLHSIYERDGSGRTETYDDVRRARLEGGIEEPMIIGAVNLDEVTTEIGGALGMSDAPGSEWSRLRWRELSDRLGLDFGTNQLAPGLRWFPYRSWPVSLLPPDEGSLDVRSLIALVDQLAAHSETGLGTPCVAYCSPLANGARFDQTWLREVELGELPTLADREDAPVGTPSNWWSLDKTWMVFTDWDLWATKVSGPAALIASIEADPWLECIRWPSPSEHG